MIKIFRQKINHSFAKVASIHVFPLKKVGNDHVFLRKNVNIQFELGKKFG